MPKVTCPKCDGRGYFVVREGGESRRYDCPSCDGTGTVERVDDRPSGEGDE